MRPPQLRYSIGELSALVWSDVFTLEQLLPIPLSLAPDCAELAGDLTMGVMFTRGPAPADGRGRAALSEHQQ